MSEMTTARRYRDEMAVRSLNRASREDHVLIDVAGDRLEIAAAEWNALPSWTATRPAAATVRTAFPERF